MTKKELDNLAEQIKSLTEEEMNIVWPSFCDWQSDKEHSKIKLKLEPFKYLNTCDKNQILAVLKREYTQTIALVLYFIDNQKASFILDNLDDNIKPDIIKRLATIKNVDPSIIRDVEQVIEKNLSEFDSVMSANPLDVVSSIINPMDKNLIEDLEDNYPEIAELIKENIFTFDDIVLLSDRSIQKILREIDSQELAKALKPANEELKNKIFRNMSERAAGMIKEDMAYMGPIRLKDVEECQRKIASVINHLEETGEIIVCKTREDLVQEDITDNNEDRLDLDLVSFKKYVPNEKVRKAFDDNGQMIQIIMSMMYKKLITVLDNEFIAKCLKKISPIKELKLLIDSGIKLGGKKVKKLSDKVKMKNLIEIFNYVEELEDMSLKD